MKKHPTPHPGTCSSVTPDLLVTRATWAAGAAACALLMPGAVGAQQQPPPRQQDPAASEAAIEPSRPLTALQAQRVAEWRSAMAKLRVPRPGGCFTASAPARAWRKVACIEPPNIPMVPKRADAVVELIDTQHEVSAQAPSGRISAATGSFDSVTGATSLSSPIGNAGAAVANAYTLQLNTNQFVTPACAASPNANCRGWEQFVYFSNGSAASVFIQYWLITYNANCPAGWNQFSFTGGTDIYCWRNAPGAIGVPVHGVGTLGQMSLTGTATAGADSATLAVGGTMNLVNGNNSVSASGGWTIAEFNVFGAGGNTAGGGRASFNTGVTVVPRTRITYGGRQAPVCAGFGFTGETNNLTLGPNPPTMTGPGPAVAFTESSGGGAATSCAAAMTIGDTHLATLGGLLYDFQAAGDFWLIQAGKDFSLQARQVSGAPTWPDASVNHAVAISSGRAELAVCLNTEGQDERIAVYIDGQKTPMADGQSIALADAAVRRTGNSFLFRDRAGNVVRTDVHPQNRGWMDVQLGLGRWPMQAQGLLAPVGDERAAVRTRDGKVYQVPFEFDAFYRHYGDSWRVSPRESKLAVCGEAPKPTNPSRPLLVRDLPPEMVERATSECREAGISKGPLFDACVMDTVVIGDREAARTFTLARPPKAIGRFR